MFGGNSNWRGPIWFPLNYLLCNSLQTYHAFFGDDFTVEYPTGSGQQKNLSEVAADLRGRLVSIFLRGADGRRPCYGWVDKLQNDPNWRDNVYFNEYFHGDNAAGSRREPSDRLDRADRGRHPPPPRRGAGGHRLHRGLHTRARTTSSDRGRHGGCPGDPRRHVRLGAPPENGSISPSPPPSRTRSRCACSTGPARRPRPRPRPLLRGRLDGFIPGLRPGQAYGYRVNGPFDPAPGCGATRRKLLLDPYARAIPGDVSSARRSSATTRPTRPSRRPRLGPVRPPLPGDRRSERGYDWAGEPPGPPVTPDTVVYELHVEGVHRAPPGHSADAAGQVRGTATRPRPPTCATSA